MQWNMNYFWFLYTVIFYYSFYEYYLTFSEKSSSLLSIALREKYLNTKFFWSVFYRIWNEYGQEKSPC